MAHGNPGESLLWEYHWRQVHWQSRLLCHRAAPKFYRHEFQYGLSSHDIDDGHPSPQKELRIDHVRGQRRQD